MWTQTGDSFLSLATQRKDNSKIKKNRSRNVTAN